MLPISRLIPSRGLHTTCTLLAKSTPDKSHHVFTYPASAFPEGYAVSATHSGIKKKAGVPDLGILVSTAQRPTSAAACLTRNVFKAAPVTVSASLLHSAQGRARGFVVNSGCANAVTGKKGLEDAWSMSKSVTERLPSPSTGEASAPGTLVMSTGVIGQHLPIDKITSSIPNLVTSLSPSPESWMQLARAFMTTDTFPKLRTRSFDLGGRTIKMAGIDKGAGMIAPNMGPPQPPHATLLGVIATDAAIAPEALQSALNYAVDRSFNSITVDGDMSTNDSIVALANGAAAAEGTEEIKEGSKEYEIFKEELRSFAEELAQLVVRDGEGATKFVTVRVQVSCTLRHYGCHCHRVCFCYVSDIYRMLPASTSPTQWPSPSHLALWSSVPCTVKVRSSSLYLPFPTQHSIWIPADDLRCQLGPYPLRGVSCASSVSINSLLSPLNHTRSLLLMYDSGYTNLPEGTISPTSVTVSFVPTAGVTDPTPLRLLTNGEPEPNIDEARASVILAEEDLEVVVDLGVKGGDEARVWTCDFSHVSAFHPFVANPQLLDAWLSSRRR